MHWDGPHAHGQRGGGSGSGSDGYIASISLDTQAGASLGKITAIRQPGGVAVTSPNSTTDIHYTKDEVDAMLASLQAQITALQPLTFKGANNATPVPVKQIQVSELPWAYYPAGEVLWIARDLPLSSNPWS